MSLSEHDIELMQSYLEGQMSAEEIQAFEQRLASEPDLNKELITHQAIDDVLFSNDETTLAQKQAQSANTQHYEDFLDKPETKALYKKLESFANETANEEVVSKGPSKFRRFMLSAAAILVIGLLSIPLLTNQGSGNKIYAEYKKFDALPSITTKSGGEEPYVNVEKAFEEKKYADAVNFYEAETSIENKDLGQLYAALAHLELKDNDSAMALLNNILENNASPQFEWAQFYKGLLLLKQKNKTEAKEVLEIIANNERHVKNYAAVELLKKIK